MEIKKEKKQRFKTGSVQIVNLKIINIEQTANLVKKKNNRIVNIKLC